MMVSVQKTLNEVRYPSHITAAGRFPQSLAGRRLQGERGRGYKVGIGVGALGTGH